MFSFGEIETAFYNQEFFLEYLPTIRLADNCCVGAEALMRWQRGDRIVPPMEFFPLIENSTLIGPLTYRSMELIGRDLVPWLHTQEDIQIAINAPPELLGRGGLRYAASTVGLHEVLDKLILEISERGIPDRLSVETMNEARKSGMKIALDDVNVNKANLLALMHVHADIVKFEKSFSDQMLREGWSDDEIAGIGALIRMGNFEVIAEGVETAEQATILKKAGVQMAQGWYFSHPLSAPDFMTYFSAHQH